MEARINNSDNLFLSYNGDDFNEFGISNFTVENSIIASSPSYFVDNKVFGAKGVERERNSIISYKVESGDTVKSVANDFGISENTIKWANSIENNTLKKGDELLILPTTGILYYVKRNDSLSQIAENHKADLNEIISFNNIEGTNITPGELLIIPNGEKPKVVPQISSHIPISSGFVAVTRGTVTQGVHPGHKNAIDIANACGTPIYAGASGTVIRTGNDPNRAGRFIWINHNGKEALYAHLQAIHVSAGQRVKAGQQIGTVGNTGYTIGITGCHLHFETRGLNPFRGLKRGDTM